MFVERLWKSIRAEKLCLRPCDTVGQAPEGVGLLLFITLVVIGNLIHLPGLVFLGAAVLALGPMQGGILTCAAADISFAATFFIVRYIGGDALRQFIGKLAKRILSHLDSSPVTSVAIFRILF